MKKNVVLKYVVFLILVYCSSGALAQSPFVPLNHRVYSFIERLSLNKSLQISMPGSLPLSRKMVAEYLIKIYHKNQESNFLSAEEEDKIRYLLFQFQDELAGFSLPNHSSRIDGIKNWRIFSGWVPKWIYGNGKNLFSWTDGDFQFFADPIYRYRMSMTDYDASDRGFEHFHFTNGFRAYGRLAKYVSFFFDFRDNKEWGSQKYPLGNYTLPRLGFVRATSPDYIYHDETEAYIRAGNRKLQVTFGKFKNIWGRGKSGALILSDYATSYDQLKLEFRHRKIYFTAVYAALIDYHYSPEDSLQAKKYLSGHRLEINPVFWLSLGLSEIVIFKGRKFEPAYLNPVMFLRSAEHYLGSPDNMMMSADFRLLPFNNVAIYGELLLDDITTTKLGTDWYGNKFGYLTGVFFAKESSLPSFDFRAEYVRLRPFVYSHENSLSYTHYADALGHWTGPNSDMFWAKANFYPHFRIRVSADFQFRRHGENTADKNVGGDIDQFWTEAAGFEAKFLAGHRVNQINSSWGIEYEILPQIYFNAGAILSRTTEKSGSGLTRTSSSVSLWTSLGMNF